MIGRFVISRVDPDERRVTTTVFGLFETASTFHQGYGRRLEHAGAVPLGPISADLNRPSAAQPDIASPDPVPTVNPVLASALEKAFDDTEGGSPQFTRAVVVVHAGKVIAERYAPGIDVNTPLLGHSMAKSVTNALIGILVNDGLFSLDQTLTAPVWRWPLTVDQLLRMDSGLPLDEPGLAYRMWFLERDSAAFAEKAALSAKPGTQWRYSNIGYAVLSRLVRDAAGGTAEVWQL